MKRHLLLLRLISVALFFLLYSKTTFSQQISYKWGKLKPQEIDLKVCSYDSSANAVVLVDKMSIYFTSMGVQYQGVKRIKILNKNGIDQANVNLKYYAGDGIEKLLKIKAQTLVTDENRKITKIPIEKKDIFDIKIDEYYNEKRFTFPSVEVGSIIEYEYILASKAYSSLKTYNFQNDIPTLHSELEVLIPKGLNYNLLMNGRRIIKKYRGNTTNLWVLKNLDALKDEEFVGNFKDYAEWIKFQLSSYYQGPNILGHNSGHQDLMDSWENLAKDVLDRDDIAWFLNKKGAAKNILETIPGISTKSDKEKMIAIYDYIRNNFTTNGYYGVSTGQKFNELLEKRKGMPTEINLLLVILLRGAGLEADPLLISTRTHGRVTKTYPMLSMFSDIVAYVKIGDKEHVLNATNAHRPYNLLSINDLNGLGYLLSKHEPRWIGINQKTGIEEMVSVSIDLLNPEKPKAKLVGRYSGYSNMFSREVLATKGAEGFLDQKIRAEISAVDTLVFTNMKNDDKSLKIDADFTLEPIYEEGDEIIYIQPNLLDIFNENPYKQEKRRLPVERPISKSYTYQFNLVIPTGYAAIEYPKDIILSLPNKYGKLIYRVTQIGDKFSITIQLKTNNRSVPPVHYRALREFYTQIGEKINGQVVLKKTT